MWSNIHFEVEDGLRELKISNFMMLCQNFSTLKHPIVYEYVQSDGDVMSFLLFVSVLHLDFR